MANDTDDPFINELVCDSPGLPGIGLIVFNVRLNLAAQDPAGGIPLFNCDGSAVSKIGSHLGIRSGHRARNANPDHLFLFLASACQNDKCNEDYSK